MESFSARAPRWVWKAAGVVVLCAVGALTLFQLTCLLVARSDAEFAACATGLPLRWATGLVVEDDAELSVQLHCYVSLEDAEDIARTRPVVHVPAPWPGSGFFRVEMLGSFPPAPGAVLHRITGCTPLHAWHGYVEPATGELWLEVLYPDWGGDSPGCPDDR